jgi:hypothetical protein
MITLYHFTTLARFGFNEPGQVDWTADLIPAPSAEWKEILGETPVVWLTTEPDPRVTWEKQPDVLLRIMVKLPSSLRLVRWADYLAKYRPDTLADWEANAPLAWGGPTAVWVYFGTIPNANHRAVTVWEAVTV